MKKVFTAFILTALVSGAAFAKDSFKLTAIGGRFQFPILSTARLSIDTPAGSNTDEEGMFSLGLDGFAEFQIINERFFLRPELDIHWGWVIYNSDRTSFFSFDLPADFGFKFNRYFDLFAGASLGFQTNDNDWNLNGNKNKGAFHLGLTPIGGDINIPLGPGALTINLKPFNMSWAFYKDFTLFQIDWVNAGIGYKFYFDRKK